MYIKQRLCMFALLLMGSVALAEAQNRIDDLVENYSTLGSSTFTSAVERNPQTHAVQRVVKVLESRGNNLSKIRKAFEDEQETGDFSVKTRDDEVTQLLTVEGKETNRIYMLQYEQFRRFGDWKVTIIVKYKNK